DDSYDISGGNDYIIGLSANEKTEFIIGDFVAGNDGVRISSLQDAINIGDWWDSDWNQKMDFTAEEQERIEQASIVFDSDIALGGWSVALYHDNNGYFLSKEYVGLPHGIAPRVVFRSMSENEYKEFSKEAESLSGNNAAITDLLLNCY
ncbi:hypothetical protein KCM76_22765, partial [Zooshikella marina]